MRIWTRAWTARIGLTGVATAVVFGTVAASGSGHASAPADALTAPYTSNDVAVSGIESALAHGEAVALRAPRITPAVACSKGVSVSASVQSGAGVTQEVRYYYDDACTTVARTIVLQTAAGGTVGDTAAISTTYNTAGDRIAQRKTTYSIGRGLGASSVRAASRLTAGTTNSVVALSNVSWDENNRGEVVSSVARIGDPQFASVGVAVQTTGSIHRSADGGADVSAESSGPLFHAPAGGLAITLEAPYQIMSAPQSRVGVQDARWAESVDARGLPSRLTVHDGALSGGMRLNVATEAGRFVGTVSDKAGKTLARLNVDRFGNGSVRYESGTSSAIADWHCI